MALVTQRICDHLENHEDFPAEGFEMAYTLNGVTVKIDQCKPCAEPYVEAFETLRLIGRSEVSKPKRDRSRNRTPPPDDGLERSSVCPFCTKAAYTTLGRLAPHVARQHKAENAAWRAENGLD